MNNQAKLMNTYNFRCYFQRKSIEKMNELEKISDEELENGQLNQKY